MADPAPQMQPAPANRPAPAQVLDVEDTPAYIATRALLDECQERGTFMAGHVDHLHQTVKAIHDGLDPIDIDRPLSQGVFRYVDGRTAGYSFRSPEGHLETPMNFSRSGLGQFARRVLGAGGSKYIEQLRTRNDTGRKLAEVNWNFGLQGETSPALLRTVILPGQTHRTVRATLSGGGRGYATIDNVDILEMLQASPEFRDLPVIDAKVTLDSMRIRMLLDPADAALFDPRTGRLLNPSGSHDMRLRIPVPMIQIGNGEIGNASFSLQWGTYTYGCLNGMLVSGGRGGDGASYRWNHVGGSDRAERIKASFGDAIKSARVAASGAVDAYKAATEVAVTDAFATLDAWAANDLTGKQIERVKASWTDETITPDSRLASVIDAVTLAAQRETDLTRQGQMERFAHRLLQKGLAQARRNAGIIDVTAEA